MSPRYHSRAEGRSMRRRQREPTRPKNQDRQSTRDGGDHDAPDLSAVPTPATPLRAYAPCPDVGTPPTPPLSFSPSPSPSSSASSPEPSSRTHSRKRTLGHVKRPSNPFIIFRSAYYKNQLEELADHAEHNNREISRAAAAAWKKMSWEAKQPYITEARQRALQHKLDHPDYKYAPQQRKEKQTRIKIRTAKRTARAKKAAYSSDDDADDSDDFDPTYAVKRPTRSHQTRLPSLIDYAATLSPFPSNKESTVDIPKPVIVDSACISRQMSPQGLPWDLADEPDTAEVLPKQLSPPFDMPVAKSEMTNPISDFRTFEDTPLYSQYGTRVTCNPPLYSDFMGIPEPVEEPSSMFSSADDSCFMAPQATTQTPDFGSPVPLYLEPEFVQLLSDLTNAAAFDII